jgi:hypothetical protein
MGSLYKKSTAEPPGALRKANALITVKPSINPGNPKPPRSFLFFARRILFLSALRALCGGFSAFYQKTQYLSPMDGFTVFS